MENKDVVVIIDGVGTVEAKNDRATFVLTIRSKNDSLDLAKNHVKEKTSQVLKELNSLKMPLDGDISTSFLNFKLEHRESGERYPAGFQAVSTLTWTVAVNNSLNDIFQFCLKIDSSMSVPMFSIKNRDVLMEQAIQKAVDNAKDKLHKECSLLNVPLNNLKILNWNFGYGGSVPTTQFANHSVMGVTGLSGSQGVVGALQGPGGYQAPVMKLGSIYQEALDAKLDPGTIAIRIAVQVKYVWAV